MKSKKLLTKKKSIKRNRTKSIRKLKKRGGFPPTKEKILEKGKHFCFTFDDLYNIILCKDNGRCCAQSILDDYKIILDQYNVVVDETRPDPIILQFNIHRLESILKLDRFNRFLKREKSTEILRRFTNMMYNPQTNLESNYFLEGMSNMSNIDTVSDISKFVKTLLTISIVYTLLCNLFNIDENADTSPSLIDIIMKFFQKDNPIYKQDRDTLYTKLQKFGMKPMFQGYKEYETEIQTRITMLKNIIANEKTIDSSYKSFFELLFDYSLTSLVISKPDGFHTSEFADQKRMQALYFRPITLPRHMMQASIQQSVQASVHA